MDLRRNINLILLLVLLGHHVKGENVVFNVKHKFGGRGGVSLKELKAHDVHRHGRMLGAADFQLGGNGSPTSSVLYFTKLSIGTPSKDYHVQVDTGSDLLWLSCAGCDNCPKESTLGIDMAQYNLQASTSGKSITCDQDVCATMFEATSSDCKVGKPCEYMVTYGDGSTSGGHFVKDNINLDQVSTGDNKTSPLQGNVTFGCSSTQSGGLGTSTNAVDGIIGFGAAKTSVISQLAAAGTVKRVFSHCLNGNSGGGIFAIGQLVEPKVNTTPLLTNRQHYTVSLKNIKVDGEVLNIPTSIFESKYSEAAIIDSGTTLAYLPSNVYNAVMGKLMAKQPKLKTHHHEGNFECFSYSGNVDNDFPVVSFKFMGNLTLTAYPHDYLFKLHDGDWCIGWQEGIEGKDGDDLFLLGDLVLSNKLFVYDLEKKTLGWTQYDCSSNIKVKDDSSENVYTVGAHNISSASTTTFTLFLSLISFLCYFFN